MGMGATLSPHTASFPRSPSPLSPNAAKGRQPLSPIQVPSYAQAMNDPLCSPIGSESRYPAPPSPSYQARKNALHSPSMETLVGSASGHGQGFGTAKKSDGFDIFGGIPVSYEPKRAPTTRWSMDRFVSFLTIVLG
ncbi:hypothetical protein BT69DRAFT_678074 [Atractiella rhizophila]|nr:hypothetical protein BT69DRAFT_678074 [Atractiella rhizophila]